MGNRVCNASINVYGERRSDGGGIKVGLCGGRYGPLKNMDLADVKFNCHAGHNG